jgi:hypothetical protein
MCWIAGSDEPWSIAIPLLVSVALVAALPVVPGGAFQPTRRRSSRHASESTLPASRKRVWANVSCRTGCELVDAGADALSAAMFAGQQTVGHLPVRPFDGPSAGVCFGDNADPVPA